MLNTAPQIQFSAILDFVYPVGSYFITESPNYDTVAKVQAHFGGTWVQLDAGRFLEACTSGAGTPKNAGLPNIKGSIGDVMAGEGSASGAFQQDIVGTLNIYKTKNSEYWKNINLDASRSSSIYKDSVTTVQPKSRTVYMYRRTA